MVDGVSITLRMQFEGSKITAVHVSPGLIVSDDTTALWKAVDKLVGIAP